MLIDINLIEEGRENPFDNVMAYLERYKLENPNNLSVITLVESQLLLLERNIQDLSEKNEKGAQKALNIVNQYCQAASYAKTSKDSFEIITKSISCISTAFLKKDFQIEKQLDILSPIEYLKRKIKGHMVSDEDVKKAAVVSLFNFSIINQNHPKAFSPDLFISKEIYDVWSIEMKIGSNSSSHHLALKFVSQFVEIFNELDGVKIVIEDIKIGSVIVKLKAYFSSQKAKDDAKELLESSKKFAIGKLEKDFIESEKYKEETKKIEVEKELLNYELSDKLSIEAAYSKALEIQDKEEDLKRKKIENQMLELDLMKKTEEAYVAMLAKGYVSQAQFEILIKGIPFIKIENGQMLISEDIQAIDEKQQ